MVVRYLYCGCSKYMKIYPRSNDMKLYYLSIHYILFYHILILITYIDILLILLQSIVIKRKTTH